MDRPLAPEGMACRLCGGQDLRLAFTQGNRGEFRFYRCAACRLVNYDLAGGLDQGKYAAEYPDPLDPDHARNRPQTQTFRFLSRHLRPPGRLLDLGCGNGRLLHLSRAAGWDVRGLELSPFLARSVTAALNIPVDIADIGDPGLAERLGRGHYDVVVLRHVLEHLPDPIRVMALFRELLAGGGHVLLEFPNIDAPNLRWKRWLARTGLARKTYPPDYRPGHCNEYCRESFRRLAEHAGFEVQVWETYSRDPVRDWLLRRFPVGTKARTLIRRQ